jgi:type IV secretion system protein VirB9
MMIPLMHAMLLAAALPPAAVDAEPGSSLTLHQWVDGGIYRLVATPGQISSIMLEPGERLISVAAGDTDQWVIGDTTSGRDELLRSLIMVKPVAAGLKTNLIIATDRRVYELALESRAHAPPATLRWTYGVPGLIAVKPRAELPARSSPDLTQLNFGYRIEGDRPPWRPIRAFDDGSQTYIQFPGGLTRSEAPPLFLKGADNRLELVNYRLKDGYYVVDRLFFAAELRLGEKKQVKVSIARAAAPAATDQGL